ncbi:hypothetical protein VTI74DRAFT_3358 [Chaetomium olivicolor]
MAQAYDDEELSISLSPSQIRRNNKASPSSSTVTNAAAANTAMASAPSSTADPNPRNHAPLRDKMRTEQRIGAYNIIKTLGEGSFGKVKLAVHRGTGQQVALKIISRKNLISRDMQGRVEREIEYLQLLRHPHIIKLYTVIKTPAEIIMVLEYAGGELFDYIVQHGKMHEDEARRFFQQMLCAVEYCHRHKIVHRDLKPENLLLDDHLNVKIADFGLSNIMTDGNFLKTSCGSPNYAAPEVIGGKLYAGPEVDVWSCGVILYVLLVGRLPFDHEHIPTLFAKIARGSYIVPTWMSPGAANLIKKMLVVNPVQRATIEEIRQDPWFLKDLPAYLHPPVEEFLNTGVDPNKAIKVSDIAPYAPPQEQEKLHNEVTEKISKTMGYGKRDVEEALEADEPSAIKDAYMIVRENKLMQSSQLGGLAAEDVTTPSPNLLDANMSSARSVASTSTGTSARPPYVSKVGILPSSVPVYHKAFMEREKARAEGIELPDAPPTVPEPAAQPRSQAEQEETLRRLKPHSRSFVRLDDASRPQGLTPVNPPKKNKPVRWQFGIRSRNAPWEALLCIYKALYKLGATWLVDEGYDAAHADHDEDDEYSRGRHSRNQSSSSRIDPAEMYKLPADPWHISIRWETDRLQKHSVASGLSEAGSKTRIDHQVVAMRMEIQIYEMERGVYLVDFKVDGYETQDGKLLEDKEVTSPFPFLDMAAKLIMQLADAD